MAGGRDGAAYLAGVSCGFVSARSARLARLSYGIFALLVANGAVFSVATQVFGDVFVLLVLGLNLGFLLAMPVLAEHEAAGVRRGESDISRVGESGVGREAWGARSRASGTR